jgi:hypothetical protein
MTVKELSIASMVRTAARSEPEFVQIVRDAFDNQGPVRTAEFFDKMNVPRSVGADNLLIPLPVLDSADDEVWTFPQEHALSMGIQKFLVRHEKKLKWHAQRPSLEGAQNVLLLFRGAMMVTDLRLNRLHRLLKSTDLLSADEWAITRELINQSYLSFRNFLRLAGGSWIDAMIMTVSREDLTELLGNYYELVDSTIRLLEVHRDKIEERRVELTVQPYGDFDPVKPPIYFGGDLLARGPWTQFWKHIIARAHHFRESAS